MVSLDWRNYFEAALTANSRYNFGRFLLKANFYRRISYAALGLVFFVDFLLFNRFNVLFPGRYLDSVDYWDIFGD